MDLSQISILAIVLAVVANMIIGALWYSPLLFANVWMKSLGKTREELHSSNPNIGYGFTTLAGIITAIILSLVITMLDSVTVGGGSVNRILSGCRYCKRTRIIAYLFRGTKVHTLFHQCRLPYRFINSHGCDYWFFIK